jgi:hypothetical protein
MNEIFIIINNKFGFVTLIFENYKNEFVFFDKVFKFQFIDKNKIQIYNDETKYILETYDSYIYSNKLNNLLNYKLIELNHNEWNDQAILNFNNNEIIRIKDKKQTGNFLKINNNLKINWKDWGEEIFKYYDENIYNHELFIHYDLKKDILVFMHVCNLNNGIDIFKEQLKKLQNSDIYYHIKHIYICYLGNIEDILNYINDDNKIIFIHLHNNIKYYEFLTMNKIKEIVKNKEEDYKILYIHNKGTRKAGNEKVIESWRLMMEYFLIEKGLHCYINLDFFDTIGINILNECLEEEAKINPNHSYHYSGNFWWSKSSYIRNLDYLNINSETNIENINLEIKRYQCENWILSNCKNRNIGIIYQDNTNLHPYHRYVFPNYKNKKLLIKNLKI